MTTEIKTKILSEGMGDQQSAGVAKAAEFAAELLQFMFEAVETDQRITAAQTDAALVFLVALRIRLSVGNDTDAEEAATLFYEKLKEVLPKVVVGVRPEGTHIHDEPETRH